MEGIIAFYVDERGNLTHQAVYRASGRADLDQAAMIAVRRARPSRRRRRAIRTPSGSTTTRAENQIGARGPDS